MACPQVVDGGLQIWRVAVSILNKQSLTADNGLSCSLGVGKRVTSGCKRNVRQGIGRTGSCGMDSSGSAQLPVAGSYKHCNEPLGSIKGGEFLDQPRDYQLFKLDSASCSWLLWPRPVPFIIHKQHVIGRCITWLCFYLDSCVYGY